ncbi:MAG TPA: hypothetical protein VKM56_07350 [Verrucomicrobiae bacterium]|nr:hypothetical protein [Verrucomicrobiae bacterium]
MLLLIVIFCVACRAIGGRAVISEDFATDPLARGWTIQGDASLFQWNRTNQNLEVTWDSSRTNSFFYVPLRTILTKSDDFSFSFDIRLKDIRTGVSVTRTDTFEIAIGLLNSRTITNANYFRGAGVSGAYGVRNLVEFDYFPQVGVIEATFATTVVSTNNRFGYAHNFPLEMTPGDLFGITVAYTASNQTLRTSATKNGAPFGKLPGNALDDVVLTGEPDFRVDAFGVSSYSDAIQTGTPDYWGSVLAHGVIDNVAITTPTPPLEHLALAISNSLARVTFDSRTNWSYTLQRSVDARSWSDAGITIAGTGGALSLSDSNAPPDQAFYRMRMERP